MNKSLPFSTVLSCYLILAVTGTSLSGCGGALGENGVPVPPVNESQFASVAAYCTTDTFKVDDPKRDGWLSAPMITSPVDSVEISAIYSPGGSTSSLLSSISMQVDRSDYRGITTSVVRTGYSRPEWVMGVTMPSVLAPKSVACVTQVARIHTPIDPFANTPFARFANPVDTTSVLYWSSYWNQALPVDTLAGYKVDGFEFVADFAPADGQAYFVLDKARFPAPQSMSICFLAPGAVTWDCKQPSLIDRGANWQLVQSGLKQGVYILMSPTLQ
ncbi:hypothetical protein [Actimicrobium antarcticum]|uniref:Lipoprotein n=1 Tax=Actimicrobium antarcticum TaxID=1051899 RepID=A0ABP7T6A0_9BURK